MRVYIQILAFIAIASIPSVLTAQTPAPGFVPFSSSTQPFKEIAKSDLKVLPQATVENGQQSAVMKHLPSTLPGKNRKFFIDHSQTDPAYYYNMPVVKPGKTSKILTAKLDPNSPYRYNMPVKKSRVVEK